MRTIFAHVLLIFLSFMCLFFFYILIVNATHAHAELQRGFYALPEPVSLKTLWALQITENFRCCAAF